VGVLDSYIQLGIESAWGTERTTGLKVIPCKGLALVPELETFESEMQTGAAGLAALFNGAVLNDGQFTSELTYNGLDWLWYMIMGTKTVTGDGSTTAYTKSFTPGTTLPSATIQKSLGNIPAGKVFTDLGVKANVVEIAFDAAAGIGQITADLKSKKEKGTTGGDTASSSGLTTITPIPIQLAAEATIWNPAAASDTGFCVLSGKIRIDRRMNRGITCLGSVTPREAKPTKPMLVTADLRVLFDSAAIYELFKAFADRTTFRMKWVGAATGIGTDFYLTDFKINRSRITKALPPLETGTDEVIANVSIKGFGSGGSAMTSEPCAIQTVNLESGAYLA
jgi:hypothetical protein